MSKDLTQKLNGSLEDKIDRLIAAVQSMDARIHSLESRVESVESRLKNVEERLGSVEERLGSVEERLGSVEERLGSLETKVEDRLKETRPMWELVQAQLQDLRESHERLRAEMEKGFRIIDRRLEIQPIELSRLHGYHRDLEERVEKIEKRLK
jgi:chromosome segregation ATPase